MLALPVEAAAAATLSLSDPTDDTWTHDAEFNFVEAPGNPQADMTKFKVRHGGRKVMITATFADLAKVGDEAALGVGIKTNEKVFLLAELSIGSGKWKGKSGISDGRGPHLKCGVGHKVDYVKDQMRIGIPRRCLSKPRWIKVEAGYSWSEGETTVMDNPHTSTMTTRWTGRIRRG